MHFIFSDWDTLCTADEYVFDTSAKLQTKALNIYSFQNVLREGSPLGLEKIPKHKVKTFWGEKIILVGLVLALD